MKHEELVNQVFSDLERKNWDKVEQHLSDNFKFSGAVPEPVGKKEWLGVHRALQTGIPDLKFNLRQVKEKGDKIIAKVKLEGTHTVEMPATPMVKRSIPATNKKVALPEEEIELSFSGNKISGLHVKPQPHGGVKGVLEQIGVKETETSSR